MFISCEEKAIEKEILVAQVGESKLTQKQLDKHLGIFTGRTSFREEYIRDWIESELLFQISNEGNLLNENNYFSIIGKSKKNLAASIAIKDYLQNHPARYSDTELKKYFNKNKEDYSFFSDAYILNYVLFRDEEDAIEFRNKAISDSWNRALSGLKNNNALLDNHQEKTFKLEDIQSKRIIRILKKLYKKEISFVIKTELNQYCIVQQIDIIRKNSIPKFKYIKESIQKTYMVIKQQELVKNYIDSLMATKNVKIY